MISSLMILAQATRPAPSGLGELLQSLQVGRTFEHTGWREWLWLVLAIFLGLVAGKAAQFVVGKFAKRLHFHQWNLHATLVESFDGPVQVAALTVALAAGILPIYHVSAPPVQSVIVGSLRLLAVISIGWFLYNVVDVISAGLMSFATRSQRSLAAQVVPLVRKTLRLFLVVVLVLFAAQYVFGADVTAWLAGLGIAGLAVSLAAQDSLKNLFGSITVLLDRPFQVGDRVIIDGHDGPVEEIGFRSTKLRKTTGELVTIPNSKVVDASVVNVHRRPYIPRSFNLALPYDTPPAKVKEAVQIIRDIFVEPQMAAGFDVEKQPPKVYFDAFNADSLNLKVEYWFHPSTDAAAYSEHAQAFNEMVLTRFHEAGIRFAMPTRTLVLAGDMNRALAQPK